MNIAVIPARGGSKRIPKKNIRQFCGKPIIAYSIEAAQQTGLFEHIIVSTDSEEIADTAKHYGAEVPFMRPNELADDYTHVTPVITHALNWLQRHGFNTEYFCCIFATAPFIKSDYIATGYKLIKKKGVSSAFSVTTFSYPVFRALKITNDGSIEMVWPEYQESRSQDLQEAYHDAGQFYWGNTKRFLTEKTFFTSDAIPILLPRLMVQDIDTPEDWDIAEKLFTAL